MDNAFVLASEHRPKAVAEATGVPVIDLSPLCMSSESVEELAIDVGKACREWGFFLVVGHGVPKGTVLQAVEAGRAFFALPAGQKLALRRTQESPLVGYYDAEHTSGVRDWKEVFDMVPHERPLEGAVKGELVVENMWPDDDLPEFRHALAEYAKAIEDLAFKLLELIARSLNMRPDRLHGFFRDQTTILRLNHYPPCPSPELALGISGHTDSGCMSILWQDDVGGLDVRRRADGQWVRIMPVHHSFVVNIGDITQVWSNDKYQSVEHRVSVNNRKGRLSIPFFFNPACYTTVQPLPEMVSEDPPKYNAYNWGEFYHFRRKATCTKQDVQVNAETAQFKKDRTV
ncbi:hypothetical protein EJB05_28505, partial [Eragrostis curvula]